MGDSEETAAQADEQGGATAVLSGGDDDNPTANGDMSGGAPAGKPQPVTNTPQLDTSQKIHPHVAILAGLVNKIIGGIQNAPGNPNNAFDRGFMNASPRNQQLQQAQVSKAMSDADTAKIQTAITGMKALQYEYLLKRLPQEDQLKHLESISAFKQNLIKEGASVEAEGDDEKASDAQAAQLNGTDSRATSHLGKFYSLPTMDKDGKAKFDVVFVPSKDVLQQDFKWTDPDGNEQTIPAGTPMSGALGKFVEAQQKGAQNQTKEQHKLMAEALGPVSDEKSSGTADWLEGQKKQNSPLYQQNAAAVDAAIPQLRAQHDRAQKDKEKTAAAGAARIEDRQLRGKDVEVHTDDGDVIMSSKEAADQGYDDFSILSTAKSQDLKDKRANADASMNALNQYEDTFRESAPKLSKGDRDAMRVLTSHVKADAGNGILGGVIDELPLVGPLNSYANKLLEGTMTSDQYKNLSPEGKKLMAQYSMAIVANFANMKQMLGSVGRNPAMIQAEMAQIPLPYLDPESAQQAFTTKKQDIEQRNKSIPKVFSKREEKLKKQMQSTAGPASQD